VGLRVRAEEVEVVGGGGHCMAANTCGGAKGAHYQKLAECGHERVSQVYSLQSTVFSPRQKAEKRRWEEKRS
jgi:hypothetical protein